MVVSLQLLRVQRCSFRTSSAMAKPKPRLQGKVALITGGASGIGEEAVRLFAANGASVVAVDIQDELGYKLVSSLGSDGLTVSFFHCDVRDEKQVQSAVDYAVQKYGSLDILFSNAGILGPFSGIVDLDMNVLDAILATNVRGVAATIKHAARSMIARKVKGSIICTASVAASVGGAGPQAYTASKHAVLGLARGACAELGKFGIRVNCISPWGVATPLNFGALHSVLPTVVTEATIAAISNTNLKGVFLKVKHVAEAALFLASDECAYISGQNLVIDGGFSTVRRSYL